MTGRRYYKHEHMTNRALHKVSEVMELAALDEPGWERKVRWIADFCREGYPTRDADLVDQDAERVAGLWLQEHFKKLQAREDEEEENRT